jgi:hypothetical protein
MNSMGNLEIQVPTMMSHQAELLDDPSRFKVICCGRRFGKSFLGHGAVVYGHGPPDEEGLPLHRGAFNSENEIAWIASSNKSLATLIWPMIERSTAQIWTHDKKLKSIENRTIQIPGRGKISCWSAEAPTTIRGKGFSGIVMDEIAHTKSPDLWFDVLRPMLMLNNGWAIFITTPNGRNWFHQLYEACDSWDDWSRWQLPSSHNPMISELEIEKMVMETQAFGRSVDQELLAKFTKPDGTYWDSDEFDDVFTWQDRADLIDGWPKHLEQTFIAVDPSLAGDYQAIAYGGFNGDGHLYVKVMMGRDSEKVFIRKLADLVQNGSYRLPTMTWIEQHANKVTGTGSIHESLKEEILRRGFSSRIETVDPSSHDFDRTPRGGLKDERIMKLDGPVKRGLLRFHGDMQTRLAVNQMIDFRPGRKSNMSRKDDGPDVIARLWQLNCHIIKGLRGQ